MPRTGENFGVCGRGFGRKWGLPPELGRGALNKSPSEIWAIRFSSKQLGTDPEPNIFFQRNFRTSSPTICRRGRSRSEGPKNFRIAKMRVLIWWRVPNGATALLLLLAILGSFNHVRVTSTLAHFLPRSFPAKPARPPSSPPKKT